MQHKGFDDSSKVLCCVIAEFGAMLKSEMIQGEEERIELLQAKSKSLPSQCCAGV